MAPQGKHQRARAKKWLATGVKGTLLSLSFVIALGAGSLIHLGLPVARRATAELLERYLDSTFEGSFEIGALTNLSSEGLLAERLVVRDPSGESVLSIERLEADIDPVDILSRIFSDYEKLSITVDRVRAIDCELHIHPSKTIAETGAPDTHITLADAFTPRDDSKDDASDSSGGRPVRVWLPKIILRNVYAHGSIAGSPILETRVPLARATLLATDVGVAVDVNRFGLTASGFSGVDTTARGEVHVRVPGAVWGDVSGTLGEVPLRQQFRVEEGHVELDGQYPQLQASALRPLIGTWPLDQPIGVRLHLSGPTDRMKVDAEISPVEPNVVPSKAVQVKGQLSLANSRRADLRVDMIDLDLSRFHSPLPPTELTAQSQVAITFGDEGPTIEVETNMDSSTVDGFELPAAQLSGSWDSEGWQASTRLNDEKLSAQVAASQRADEPLHYEIQLFPTSWHGSPLLRSLVPELVGVLSGTAHGTFDGDQLTVNLDLRAATTRYEVLSVRDARLQASLSGSIDRPASFTGTSSISGREVNIGKVQVYRVEVSQTGPLLTPKLGIGATTTTGLTLTAEGTLDLPRSTARDWTARLQGKDEPIDLTVTEARLAPRLLVKGFSLRSIGTIDGSVEFLREGFSARVQARGLSVSRISQALGLAQGELEGDLNADIDLTVDNDPRGNVSLSIKNGAFLGVSGVEVDAETQIQGRHIDGTLRTSVANLAHMRSNWSLNLGGSPLERESYADADGHFELDAKNIDLSTLSLLFGQGDLPRLGGTGTLSVALDRERGQVPSGTLRLETQGLRVDLPKSEFSSRGVDVQLVTSAPSLDKPLEAALRLTDPFGQLLSLSGSLRLPWTRWDEIPASREGLGQDLTQAEIQLVALLPDRKLTRLPLFLPRVVDSGWLSGRASVTGSLAQPDLNFVLSAREWEGEKSPFAQPMDATINARYRHASAGLVGSLIVERGENRFGSVQFEARLLSQVADLLVSPSNWSRFDSLDRNVPWWTGNLQVFLESTPLSQLRVTQQAKLLGKTRGTIQIEREALMPRLSAELAFADIAVDGHDIGDALVQMENLDTDLIARMEFRDESGSMKVAAETGLRTHPVWVEVDRARPMRVTAEASRYDSAVFLPLLGNVFDEFSGPLIGRVTAVVEPSQEATSPLSVSLGGELRLEEGTLTPTALGTRLRNVRGSIKVHAQGGENVLVLDDFRARTDLSEENLRGRAELRFENLSPTGGRFELMPRDMPLRAGGSTLAVLTGTVQGDFAWTDAGLEANVSVDPMLAELPENARSGLIELEENPSIEIVQQRKEVEVTSDEAPALPVSVQIDLGKNVRVKGSLFDVRLAGSPTLRLTESVSMGGAVELGSGSRFVVLGRSFIVERGIILFDTDDPSAPNIQAIASWKAPNGVLVRVTVGGTLDALTLEWSSEPALRGGEADIISLVLGGGGGSDEQSVGSTSIAIAANELADVEGLEFYTTSHASSSEGRVASLTDSTWDSYTASYQINDKLWFEGSFQSGSMGLDTVPRNGVSGTLDWRFHPHWSARTEVGTLGAGLDMVWQYRY